MTISKYAIELRAISAYRWLELLFGAWLLLAVLTPEDVYRTFFHALIYPLTLYLLIRKNGGALAWKDPFIRLFLVFCGYMAVTTWFVGGGPGDNDWQATRWGVEAGLGMVAFFFWMRATLSNAVVWGRWLLFSALIGAMGGFLTANPATFLDSRLQGLGTMAHPIQGASIVSVLLAVGLFLTLGRKHAIEKKDLVLGIVSSSVVWVFVVLTLSRAPIMSLIVYLLAFGIILCFQYRRGAAYAPALVVGIICLGGLAHWSLGLSNVIDPLIARGTSFRLEIWTAYLTHLPDSILLGNGAGIDFRLTDPYLLYLEPKGLDIAHPHNIWLGALSETGLIGLFLQAGLLIIPAVAVIRSKQLTSVKFHLLAILGLFALLTFSDEYTLLTSIRAIWLFGWIPLVFVWAWAKYGSSVSASEGFGGRAGVRR